MWSENLLCNLLIFAEAFRGCFGRDFVRWVVNGRRTTDVQVVGQVSRTFSLSPCQDSNPGRIGEGRVHLPLSHPNPN